MFGFAPAFPLYARREAMILRVSPRNPPPGVVEFSLAANSISFSVWGYFVSPIPSPIELPELPYPALHPKLRTRALTPQSLLLAEDPPRPSILTQQ